MNNNRLSLTVLKLYGEAVLKANGLPCITRSDGGTENVHVATYQTHAYGPEAHIYGCSTRNTRIEGAWRQMRDRSMDDWMAFFQRLTALGIYRPSDDYHIMVARYLFTDMINYDLELFRETWNRHRIRKQANYGNPGGVPDVMYYHSNNNFLCPIPCGFFEHMDETLLDTMANADMFDNLNATAYLNSIGLGLINHENKERAFQALLNHTPLFLL